MICKKCGQRGKTFYKKRRVCKDCVAIHQRYQRIARKYALSRAAYNNLVASQHSTCAICHRGLPLVVDHDHATGIVRGLLCSPCNLAIGIFEDDVHRLNSAVRYLRA